MSTGGVGFDLSSFTLEMRPSQHAHALRLLDGVAHRPILLGNLQQARAGDGACRVTSLRNLVIQRADGVETDVFDVNPPDLLPLDLSASACAQKASGSSAIFLRTVRRSPSAPTSMVGAERREYERKLLYAVQHFRNLVNKVGESTSQYLPASLESCYDRFVLFLT